MPAPPLIRIISDLHYGDRSGRIKDLAGLGPLVPEAGELVLNGDTLDTRPGYETVAGRRRAEVLAFVGQCLVPVRLLTGNHDPDISPDHWHELAGGQVLVTHGDIAFEDIVPWGRDAALARQLVAAARRELPDASLASLLAAHRRAAATIPQQHQSEPHLGRYLRSFLRDTFWPPSRIPCILRAWAEHPGRMARLIRPERAAARFIIVGHTHRPGFWRLPGGLVVINTGSFCPPLGPRLVEVAPDHVSLRHIVLRRGEARPAGTLAEFALATA
jgi:predicted phosphodiesterase